MILDPRAATRLQRFSLNRLRRFTRDAPIRLRLDTGRYVLSNGKGPECIVFHDPLLLFTLMLDPEVGFGDAYMNERIQVEGDLVNALEILFHALNKPSNPRWFDRIFSIWLQLTQANTLGGSLSNVHHHYDMNTDFYKLWLDRQLVYTCAYFPTPTSTLEEAQAAKLDYICRKLQLRPREKVIEVGCGWGALALHIARRYGATVRSYNISHEQIEYARLRAQKEGLSHLVEFIEDDYRNITGHFDAFISVGMLEHVGREHFHELEDAIFRAIGDSGRGLLHFIGRNRPEYFSTWIRKRIFPGGYAPALREVVGLLEKRNYSVLDIENLRQHYALTLQHWLNRYRHSSTSIRELFGTEFFRSWELYLAGSTAAFRTGQLQLFQIVFAGATCHSNAWTRAHLYNDDRTAKEDQWSSAAF